MNGLQLSAKFLVILKNETADAIGEVELPKSTLDHTTFAEVDCQAMIEYHYQILVVMLEIVKVDQSILTSLAFVTAFGSFGLVGPQAANFSFVLFQQALYFAFVLLSALFLPYLPIWFTLPIAQSVSAQVQSYRLNYARSILLVVVIFGFLP